MTLSLPAPAAEQLLSLPVWVPGSYMVRDFARHLSMLTARQGRRSVPLTQLDKTTWRADCAGRAPLVLSRHFTQDIFTLAIAAKDIEVALASAAALGTPMPMTAAAATVYQDALRAGLGGEDFYATVKVLEAAAGVSVPPLKR